MPISVLVPIVIFFNINQYSASCGGGPLLWVFFSQIQFCQEELYPPVYACLWVKLVHLLLKAISMLKPWKCKVPEMIRFLMKPFVKNSTQTIFQGGTPWVTHTLNNVKSLLGWHPIVRKNFRGGKKHKTFYLEKAISMLKPWRCKVIQIIRCLTKPWLKNSTQTIFQWGTPWVTQIPNIAQYCAQKLLGS